jgi:hypothetical protein
MSFFLISELDTEKTVAKNSKDLFATLDDKDEGSPSILSS